MQGSFGGGPLRSWNIALLAHHPEPPSVYIIGTIMQYPKISRGPGEGSERGGGLMPPCTPPPKCSPGCTCSVQMFQCSESPADLQLPHLPLSLLQQGRLILVKLLRLMMMTSHAAEITCTNFNEISIFPLPLSVYQSSFSSVWRGIGSELCYN